LKFFWWWIKLFIIFINCKKKIEDVNGTSYFDFGTYSLFIWNWFPFHACFFYPIPFFMEPIPNFLLHFLWQEVVVVLGVEAFHYNRVEGCLCICLCWTLLLVVVIGIFSVKDGHGATVGYFWVAYGGAMLIK